MTDEKIKLIIGSLLHDIGKVVYREGDDRRNHSISGYDFLKENAKSIITPVIISNYEDYADLGKVETGAAEAGKTVVLDIKK